MRPIKFRGRKTDNSGEYVYAELGQISEEKINPGYLSFITDDDMYTVKADSIAQLVGYDTNGKEVYEGDTVIWNDLPMTAKFITNISGGEVLKEDDQ